MINQRRTVPRRRRARQPGVLWDPHVPDVTPRPDDIYLVVDEQDGGTVVILAARWPELDALGRLRFEDRTPIAIPLEQETLERAIRRPRARTAPPRPLRIGDVFLVRGLPTETDTQLEQALASQPPSKWGKFIDVTGAARDAAKTALFAAAAPRVSTQHAETLGLLEQAPPEEPPPAATTAGPVV